MQKIRPLLPSTIKKIYRESVQGFGVVDSNGWIMNIRGFKFYAFTPDYYNGKPSWSGNYWNDMRDCYFYSNGNPVEKYALGLDGTVYDLEKRISLIKYNLQ